MRHKMTAWVLGLSVFVGGIAQAGDSVKDALSLVPGDVMGVVFVPSPKQLDADYQTMVNTLELQMFAPPSLLSLVKMQLPVLQSMDDTGVFAVAFLPTDNLGAMQQSQVLMVPTTDVKGMVEALGGQESEGGIWAVNLMGQPAYAAGKGKHLIVGATAEAVQKVVGCKTNLAGTMKSTDLQAMANVDIGIWLDAERLMGMLKPMIEGMLPMMTMGQPAAAAEINKQNIDKFVNGVSTMGIGLLIDNGGLGLRFAMSTKDGSDLAKQMKMKPTTGSLLKGLEGGKYILASGQTVDPEQVTESVGQLDQLFALAGNVDGLNQDKMSELKSLLKEWAPSMRASRALIQALPPGPDGLFGLSIVVKTKDSKAFMASAGKAMAMCKDIAADFAKRKTDAEGDEEGEGEGANEEAAEWAKKLSDLFVHVAGAEDVAGAKVDHFKVDLSKTDEIDEEDVETAYKIIGKEGLLLRVAPADDQTIVVAFGGGTDRMSKVIEYARKNEPAIDDDAGVKKVASHLPESRAWVAYVSADQIIHGVNNVLTALEEENLPIQLPEDLNAPIAMSATGGAGWMQGDLFLPSDLLVAAKNVGLAMMGSAMTAPPAESEEPAPE